MGKIQDSDYKSALNRAINEPFKVITFTSGRYDPKRVVDGDLDNIPFYQVLYGFETDGPVAIICNQTTNEYEILGDSTITPLYYTRTDEAYRGNYSSNDKLFNQDGSINLSKENIKNYCSVRTTSVGTIQTPNDFEEMYNNLLTYKYNSTPYYLGSLLMPWLFKKGIKANEVGVLYPVKNAIWEGSEWVNPWGLYTKLPNFISQFDAIKHYSTNGYSAQLQSDFDFYAGQLDGIKFPFSNNIQLPDTSNDFYTQLSETKEGFFHAIEPNFISAKRILGVPTDKALTENYINGATTEMRDEILDNFETQRGFRPLYETLYFDNFLNYEDDETRLQGDYYYIGGSVPSLPGTVLMNRFSNIQVNAINIPIFASDDYEKNKEEAEKFLKDPENYVPDDTMSLNTTDPNGKPSSIVPDTPDDEDETSDDSDSRDSSDFPDSVDNTSCNRLYEVNRGELNGFINWFWNGGSQFDQSFIDWMTGACGDITQAVISCHFIPYDFEPPTTDMQVKLSYLDTSFRWDAVTDNVRRKFLGEISIGYNQKNKSFLDFSPYTELQLYLPYAGVISLDNNIFMGKKVALDLICDLQDGSGNYAISVVSNGIKTMVDEVPVQLGISIPFTLSDASQKNANLLNSVINSSLGVIGGAMSGSPLMIAGSVSNFSQNVPPSKQIGSVVGAPGLGLPQQPMLYIKRPVFNYPDNYGFHVGYPCYKNYTLNQVSGYTICENPKIRSFSKSITDNEYNEIINLLKEGVII